MGKPKFTKVSPRVWQSSRFRDLTEPDSQVLFFYFLTSPHQCSAGAYQVPKGYVCADLSWDLPRYEKARGALIEADLIAYDDENETVFIRRWFQHCPAQNKSHQQAIMRMLNELESGEIAALALSEFETAEPNDHPFDRSGNVGAKVSDELLQRIGGRR